MPDAAPTGDALDAAPAPAEAAPEPAPAEPAAEEPVAETPVAPVADETPVGEVAPDDEAPTAEEAASAETVTSDPAEDAPDAEDSVEKVLSNAAMDNIFGTDDEADAPGTSDGDTTEDATPDQTEEVSTAWTADDADSAADDARADGFPAPPGAADESDSDEPAVAAAGGKRSSGLMRLISLLTLVLLITAVAGVGYFMQSKIVMWFPATSKIYAMVGLKPDVLGQGLHIADPKPTKEIDGNDEVLIVNGAIKNTSGNRQKVPLLRGALLDKDGKELHIWTFTAQQESIEPGEQVTYQTQFKNPPAAAEKLDITFTRPGDAQTAGRGPAMPDKK